MIAENAEAKSISSRRTFLGNVALAAAKRDPSSTKFSREPRWLEAAQAASTDLVHDTFNGLLAFVVPGPDGYSVSQGVTTSEPGGVGAGVTDVLITTLDGSTPFLPQFSATVAAVLNGLARVVKPFSPGTFISPFARLSFAEKAAVFQIMDATHSLKPLAGVLPALVAAFCYSEGSPSTRRHGR